MDDYAAEYLFKPLGIRDYEWKYITPEIVYASGKLALRPRDLAKFGYLYFNDGIWNGEHILSSEWMNDSIQEHISIPGRSKYGDGYGDQWFLKSYPCNSSSLEVVVRTGWRGQAIILLPDIEMMAVLTGGNDIGQEPVDEILTEFILPAVE